MVVVVRSPRPGSSVDVVERVPSEAATRFGSQEDK